MKHERAYCKNGTTYKPCDIRERNSLVEMRYYGLTDVKRQFELVAVNSQNPFFRFKNSPGKNLSRIENNPNHNYIRDKLIEKLSSGKSLLIYTNEFIDSKDGLIKEKIPSAIVNLDFETYRSYKWIPEKYKKISNDEYSYFDICGFSSEEPFSNTVKPIIIIEVVLTSFLKEKVFEFHCKNSKIDNTVCVIFYIPENLPKRELCNYWNNLEDNKDELKMRVTHYIDNGFFFRGKSEIAYLGKDKKVDGQFVRPKFKNFIEEQEYWGKYHIYVEENYIKKAKQKLNEK